MSDWRSPRSFDPKRHKTGKFDSGRPELDEWLQRYAGQNERRGSSRSFVVADEGDRVIAYYTLVASEVEVSDATRTVARGMSRRFPIPACRLARLAVDRGEQGKGLGAAVLADALTRAVRAAEQVGMRAIVVDAIDDAAAAFYRRFGLEPVTDDGLVLMTTVSNVLAAVELAGRAYVDVGDVVAGDWWELRENWGTALVLLGGLGYRPKLNSSGLVMYRHDGSSLILADKRDLLPPFPDEDELILRLLGTGGTELARRNVVVIAGYEEHLVEAVEELSRAEPPGAEPGDSFRHFPPEDELSRRKLTAAYAALRPELDALAVYGIHAYIEDAADGIRLYCDIARTLLLNISIDDVAIPISGPRDGEWVVFLDNLDGHEAEFTVGRSSDRNKDAETLARAVVAAIKRALSGGRVLLEHYDPRLGRFDAPF